MTAPAPTRVTRQGLSQVGFWQGGPVARMMEGAILEVPEQGLEPRDVNTVTSVANADGHTLEVVIHTELNMAKNPGML